MLRICHRQINTIACGEDDLQDRDNDLLMPFLSMMFKNYLHCILKLWVSSICPMYNGFRRVQLMNHFAIAGIDCFACEAACLTSEAAASASFWTFSVRTLRTWANRTMNKISILSSISDRSVSARIDLQVRSRSDHLSLVIMSSPCTRTPLVICGRIPLKSASGPSCSTI